MNKCKNGKEPIIIGMGENKGGKFISLLSLLLYLLSRQFDSLQVYFIGPKKFRLQANCSVTMGQLGRYSAASERDRHSEQGIQWDTVLLLLCCRVDRKMLRTH